MEIALAFSLGMIFTASSVYQVTVAKLSALELVLVGTALETAVFLFEVPTGVVADVYSRKWSIIIGFFLMGAGFILEGTFPIFASILSAQILWGLGYTFTSGATEAWITDEIGESTAARVFLQSSQLGQIATLLGLGVGIILGNVRINIPIQLGGMSIVISGMFAAFLMSEDGFRPVSTSERTSWRSMMNTFQDGFETVRSNSDLLRILGIGLIFGLYSEGFDRLWTKHLIDNFSFPDVFDWQPIVWIGLIRAVGMLISVASVGLARKKVNTDNQLRIASAFFVLTAILFSSLIGFSLVDILLLAVVSYWMITASRNVIGPLYTAWVNRRLESAVRATVLSMSSQVDAIGQIVGGPFLGAIGSMLSVRAALFTSSVILSPTLVLIKYAFDAFNRKNHETS